MITVDGVALEWDNEPMSIYQFLFQNGVVVPCFCYHEKLIIAGNCRMCLVEANGSVAVSCAIPLADGMQIFTQSERLDHARENVLEFLLSNHPLDCPICDQGGECDLQDISKTFGLDRGRFYETKRSVDNLNCFGSLIKTLMTRCIHCTRCVRFLSEFCDTQLFGVIGRGGAMEIGSFAQTPFVDDPLSANVIDLCPVGALLSMPSAYSARPWEWKSIESIDIMDSMAGSLRFEVAKNHLARCAPTVNENLNEDWMTNKARFVYYSLQHQNSTRPTLKVSNDWISISWRQAAITIMDSLLFKQTPLAVRTGNFLDLETAALLKYFCQSFNQSAPYNEAIGKASAQFPELFLFNSSMEQLENTSLVLLIGSDLRKENPLLYLRIRRNYLKSRSAEWPLVVFSIGSACMYENLPIRQLGATVESLELLMEGRLNGVKDFFFAGFQNIFKVTREGMRPHPHPKMIIGPGIFRLPQAGELQRRLWNFALLWQKLQGTRYHAEPIYNAALDHLGKLSMFAVDCVEGPASSFDDSHSQGRLIWNFMTETAGPLRLRPKDFVIYQGYYLPPTHTAQTNLFLPTAAPLERRADFLNIFGTVRSSKLVLSPAKTTYTDAQLVRFFHRFARIWLREKNQQSAMAHALAAQASQFPWQGDFAEGFHQIFGFLLRADQPWIADKQLSYFNHNKKLQVTDGPLTNAIIGGVAPNYYESDVLSRLSPILTSCALKCVPTNFAPRTGAD